MKQIALLTSVLFLFVASLFSQIPPAKMSYQIVVRDNNNELVVNRLVGVRVSVLEDVPTGVAVFQETHSVTTNANALATLQLGTGTLSVGTTLADIDWGHHDYFLQTEIDPAGGSAYSVVGTQQLLTVPYAFYSGKTSYFDYNDLDNRPVGSNPGDLLYWDGAKWAIISAGLPGNTLVMGNNNVPGWSNVNGTLGNAPIVETDSVFNITGRTASVQCHIVNPGSTGVIASGVCWSTNPYPSLGNNYTSDGMSVDTFVSAVSALTSGTVYYVRAYATNSIGTSYGTPIKFITPVHCGTVTDYDNNTYNTVYIGSQCWMKENLKTTHYSNGAAISAGVNGSYNGKYYFKYLHADSNKTAYGLLYTWSAVMNGAGSSNNNPSGIQGICPSGWHVPSNTEWCELENYIEPGIDVTCSSTGVRGSMAKKVTATKSWSLYTQNAFAPGYWSVNPLGFDESGFSALPAGYYSSNGAPYFYSKNTNAYFWTCTATNSYYAYIRYIEYDKSGIGMTTWQMNNDIHGLSVRCVKN